MSSQGDDLATDKRSGSTNWAALAFLGLGALIGWSFHPNNGYDDALGWVLSTSQHCEISYKADGYVSVTDCLRSAMKKGADERRGDNPIEDDESVF